MLLQNKLQTNKHLKCIIKHESDMFCTTNYCEAIVEKTKNGLNLKDCLQIIYFKNNDHVHISLGSLKSFKNIGPTYFLTYDAENQWHSFTHVLKIGN